jgi:hypothetical protein
VYKKFFEFFDNIYLFLKNKRIFINSSIFPGKQIFNVHWCTYTTLDPRYLMFENLGYVRRYVRTGCLLTRTEMPLYLKINIFLNLK